jgi:hypothetical protein
MQAIIPQNYSPSGTRKQTIPKFAATVKPAGYFSCTDWMDFRYFTRLSKRT